jgi:ribonuclease BN (tRNA processing enzyme)
MKLVILGSGTCVPSLNRSSPAYYIKGEGREVLLDCGGGTVLQLEKIGKSYKNIDALFITHTHPDHIAGLLPLIHAMVATPLFKREKIFTLAGPPGTMKFFKGHIVPFFGKVVTSFIQVREIEDKMDYPPFHILTTRTMHSSNSTAYRFEKSGHAIVFSGDADYDQGIVELAKDCDLLIADCAFPESMKKQGHMTPKECGLLARNAGAKKLLLSHLHALPVSDNDKLRECRKVFQGDVSIAEDLMEFDF